jgi:hypothetical protein
VRTSPNCRPLSISVPGIADALFCALAFEVGRAIRYGRRLRRCDGGPDVEPSRYSSFTTFSTFTRRQGALVLGRVSQTLFSLIFVIVTPGHSASAGNVSARLFEAAEKVRAKSLNAWARKLGPRL